ncbi:MAG: hypothetical protein HQL03_03815 [Nitrospirae bacterium]|nr:hypothetical protein [Nitrospirota bacterium]MBF0592289.1 hypothetical protein [Nitrospirota bacterium]
MKDKDITQDGDNGHVRRSEFDDLKEMFAELKEMFLVMMQKQDRMASDITSIKDEQERMGLELKRVGDKQDRMASDIGTLKTDVDTLKTDVDTLKTDVTSINRNLGGLSRSVSYALENEAYRELPRFLKDKYGIEISERLIRTEVKGCEINILGKGTRQGTPVLIVGEAKLRLQGYYTAGTSAHWRMSEVFHQLESNVQTVRREHKDVEVVSILITHFATQDFLNEASKKGVIVIQSHEW